MRTAAALTLLVIFPGVAAASDPAGPDPWVGRQVVARQRTPLRVGDKRIDGARDHRVYRVKKVDKDRLWIEGGGAAGWVDAGAVVPVADATRYCNRLIRTNAKDADAYLLRGLIWLDKRQYDVAIADFSQAIRLAPKDAAAFANRGSAWAGKQAFDRAIQDFDRALRLDPSFAVAYRNRADARAARGDFDRAFNDFEKALRLDPGDALAYNERGWAHYLRKDYERAIKDFDEALRRDPSLAWAHSNRGLARVFLKDYAGASRDFDEAVRIDPELAAAHNNRAWLLASCPEANYRDGLKAIASATRACELDGWKRPAFLDTLAAAYAEAGDLGTARRWQARALELARDGDKDLEAIRAHYEEYQAKASTREP